MNPLVRIRDLSITLPEGSDRPLALDGVSVDIARGELLCLVGESGSGKSVLASAIAGLLPKDGPSIARGTVVFDGIDLVSLHEARFRTLRGKRIGFVFQEPMTALNPVLTIGRQIEEALAAHDFGDAPTRRARMLELVRAMQLPDPENVVHRYPHEISGGQRQRVMIAIAIANAPDLLIADEPTTALDVTTQADILALIARIRRQFGLTVLFITHDFGVVADIADRVVVMRHGRVVEQGETRRILDRPAEAYTRALIDAVPVLGIGRDNGRDRTPGKPLLAVSGVVKTYAGRSIGLFGRRQQTSALKGIDLVLHRGETLALVGESGSGKSTLGQCIAGLTAWDGGSIVFDGADLGGQEARTRRKRIQMVFQDPFGSLNPRHRIERIMTEAVIVHGLPRAQAQARMRALLERVGLDAGAAQRYPHAFSGGQRQRIGLARALMLEPDLLIADEPVSALDVSVQAQVLALLDDVRREFSLTILFITHDLRVASTVADRIAVMRRGEIVEIGPARQVLHAPRDEYTRRLLDAIPGMGWERARRRPAV